ncbi:hypothetical protein F5890DRAFT_1552658 [Lentinula detonsa]|uniref:Uncharacterized protein n=1 Tax=Lentinula detonsa TaxID=2804962 RepID=A0AA38UTH8_9AGAR|nr:hypothetical protein F5890DRAFT_1552658 [Lentinula detonsa]
MTLLFRFLRLYAFSSLFYHLVGALHLSLPPNFDPCLLRNLSWLREPGDPQDIGLFLEDLAQNIKQAIPAIGLSAGLSTEQGTAQISPSHPGDFAIRAEDNNGSLISSLPITIPDCTTGSTLLKTSISKSTEPTATSSSSIPSVTAVSSPSSKFSSRTVLTTSPAVTSKGTPSMSSLSLSNFPLSLNISFSSSPNPNKPKPSATITPLNSTGLAAPFSKTHSWTSSSSTPSKNGPQKGGPLSVMPTATSTWPPISSPSSNVGHSIVKTSPSSIISVGFSHSPTTIIQATASPISIDESIFSTSDFETLIGGLSSSANFGSPGSATTTAPHESPSNSNSSPGIITHALATALENPGSISSTTNLHTASVESTEISSLAPTISLPPTPTLQSIPTSTASQNSPGSSPDPQNIQQTMSQPSAIAGVTIGAIILTVVMSLLITLCMIKRRRKRRFNDRISRKSLNPFLYQAVSSSGSQGQSRDHTTTGVLSDPESAPVQEISEADSRPSRRGWNLKAQLRKWRSSNGVIEPFIIPRIGRHTAGMREVTGSRRMEAQDFDGDSGNLSEMQEERSFLRSSSVLSVATSTTARMSSVMTRSSPSDPEYQINRLHGSLNYHHHHHRTQSPLEDSLNARFYPESSNSRRHGNGSGGKGSSTTTTAVARADYPAALPHSTSSPHARSPLPSYNSFNSPLAMASEAPQLKRMSFQSSWANDPFLSNQELERLAADEDEADWAMDGFLEPIAPDDLPPAYNN